MNSPNQRPVPNANAIPERWWLCWSADSDLFAIEREADGISMNLWAYEHCTPGGYLPIGVFAAQSEAQAAADRLRSKHPGRHDIRFGPEEPV